MFHLRSVCLDRADAHVTFYMRITEEERLVAVFAASGRLPAIGESRVPPPLPLGRLEVAYIASSWIDIASLAVHILDPQLRPPDFDDQVERSFRTRLDQALRSAQATFPDDAGTATK
jgi:hypothetical protein